MPGVFLGIPLRALRLAFLSVLITLVVAPILGLPYMNDDIINRNAPLLSLGQTVDLFLKLNDTWMTEQGRFFPGGLIYGFTMWNTMNSRPLYAMYLVLLNLCLVTLFAYTCWRILKSAWFAAFGAITLAACLQIQFGYFDGLSSFGGLVVYTLVLVFLTGLLAAHILHGGSRWFVIPLAIVWGLAITAYEVSLLMLPALLAVLWVTGPPLRERARWLWAAGPIVLLGAAQFAMVLYLRSPDLPLAPAYQINMDGPVGTTFAKQFTAAIPYAQQMFGDAAVHGGMWLLLSIVLAIPAFLVWRPWRAAAPVIRTRVAIVMMAVGAWAWIIPSILAGVTRRQQGELTWGHGYIYLPYEYVGVALIVTGAACLIRQKVTAPWARWIFAGLFLVVLLVCAMTAGSNILGVGAHVPGPVGPDWLPPAG